jgi:hypothetical protein
LTESSPAGPAASANAWLGYLQKRPEVIGWFYAPDPMLFATILGRQFESGVTGDILEIGTYAGKSAILLGFGLGDGETLHVSDLFVFPRLGDDPECGRALFIENYTRFHAQVPDIIVGPSSELDFGAQAFKFVHVDGSHLFNDVVGDIEIACRLCRSGSVIVMDDHSNPSYPGVAAATWGAVARGQMVPFCANSNKLYCAVDPDTARDMSDAVARALEGTHEVGVDREEIAGHEVLVLEMRTLSGRSALIRDLTPPVVVRLAARATRRRRPPSGASRHT